MNRGVLWILVIGLTQFLCVLMFGHVSVGAFLGSIAGLALRELVLMRQEEK